MQTVSINFEQFTDLCNYTRFETLPDEMNLSLCREVEISEDGTLTLFRGGNEGEDAKEKDTYGDATTPAWEIDGRQDFDLLVRLIDSEFGIEGMGLSDIYDGLNDHIDTIGATEEYSDYCWNDDNARRYAEIEGTEYKPFYEDPERGGDWSWNPQSYKFFFNVDSDNECADYQGLSPREAWEAIQKYNEA